MTRPLLTTLMAAGALSLTAVTAQATVCQTQPGQGAIDQYCEIIPSGGGERPGGPRREQEALTAETQETLRQAGTDGAIVEALAMTSPAPAGSGQGGSAGETPGTSPAPPGTTDTGEGATADVVAGASSKSTLDAVLGDPFGDSVGGTWVLWAGLAIALAAGIAAWRRRVPGS